MRPVLPDDDMHTESDDISTSSYSNQPRFTTKAEENVTPDTTDPDGASLVTKLPPLPQTDWCAVVLKGRVGDKELMYIESTLHNIIVELLDTTSIRLTHKVQVCTSNQVDTITVVYFRVHHNSHELPPPQVRALLSQLSAQELQDLFTSPIHWEQLSQHNPCEGGIVPAPVSGMGQSWLSANIWILAIIVLASVLFLTIITVVIVRHFRSRSKYDVNNKHKSTSSYESTMSNGTQASPPVNQAARDSLQPLDTANQSAFFNAMYGTLDRPGSTLKEDEETLVKSTDSCDSGHYDVPRRENQYDDVPTGNIHYDTPVDVQENPYELSE